MSFYKYQDGALGTLMTQRFFVTFCKIIPSLLDPGDPSRDCDPSTKPGASKKSDASSDYPKSGPQKSDLNHSEIESLQSLMTTKPGLPSIFSKCF